MQDLTAPEAWTIQFWLTLPNSFKTDSMEGTRYHRGKNVECQIHPKPALWPSRALTILNHAGEAKRFKMAKVDKIKKF